MVSGESIIKRHIMARAEIKNDLENDKILMSGQNIFIPCKKGWLYLVALDFRSSSFGE